MISRPAIGSQHGGGGGDDDGGGTLGSCNATGRVWAAPAAGGEGDGDAGRGDEGVAGGLAGGGVVGVPAGVRWVRWNRTAGGRQPLWAMQRRAGHCVQVRREAGGSGKEGGMKCSMKHTGTMQGRRGR